MKILDWEQLPPEMQTESVRKYYDVLKKKKAVLNTASVSPIRTIPQLRIRFCRSNSSDRNVLVHPQGFEPWEQG